MPENESQAPVPFRYVRRKDDHTIILSQGYSDFTGSFNSAVYEQITGEPVPEGATVEKYQTPEEKTKERRGMMGRYYNSLPSALRLAFSDTIVKVNSLLDLGDFTLALEIAQATDISIVPEDLQDDAATAKATFIGGLQALVS